MEKEKTLQLNFFDKNTGEAKIIRTEIEKIGNEKIKKQIDKISEEIKKLSNILYVKELENFVIKTDNFIVKKVIE